MCMCDVCVWLPLLYAIGVNYVQKVVTVSITGGVFITCKFPIMLDALSSSHPGHSRKVAVPSQAMKG